MFTECEFEGGYDMSIGTSERGEAVHTIIDEQSSTFVGPTWKHLVIVIGGVAGLEVALQADTELQQTGITQVSELFDRWINVVPDQGSRTIRTEEAAWITLSRLRSLIESR